MVDGGGGGVGDGGVGLFSVSPSHQPPAPLVFFLKADLLTFTIKGMLIAPSRRGKVLNGYPPLRAPEPGSQLPDRPNFGPHLSKRASESL